MIHKNDQFPTGVGLRRQITDDLLREVAAVLATNPSNKPKAIAEHFSTSERNASRWIAAARKRIADDRLAVAGGDPGLLTSYRTLATGTNRWPADTDWLNYWLAGQS